MKIGNAIQLARARRKLSQAQLAQRSGMSVSYLSLLERSLRDPPLSTLQRIATGLNVPLEILFFLGAEGNDLGGMNKDLAGQLATMALDLLSEPEPIKTDLSV